MSLHNMKRATITMTLTQSSATKAVKSYTMSKRYINQVIKGSVINILYHRLYWNERENHFTSKTFNNVEFKDFKSKSKNRLIRDCQSNLIACKEAFDKDYLKEMHLYFVDTANNDDIVEYYKFGFQYSSAEEHEPKSAENLTEVTTEFLTNLKGLAEFSKLENAEVRVEFTYFPDTPMDYQPTGFENVDFAETFFKKTKQLNFSKKRNSVQLGALNTGFHMLKCRAHGDLYSVENMSQKNVQVEQKEKVIKQETNQPNFTEDFSQYTEENVIDLTSEPGVNNLNETFQSISAENVEVNNTELDYAINCQCQLPSTELAIDEISCVGCNQKYHTACQGFLNKTFLNQEYYCWYCSNAENSKQLSDANFIASFKQPICRIRYLLACIYNYGRIPRGMDQVFDPTLQNLKQLFMTNTKSNEVFGQLFRFVSTHPEIMEKCQNFFQA